jgi:uncharacterized protein (DUF1015 family)
MAEIQAFHGVRYNPARVGELADVLCPPYDIIDARFQQELYERSPYNFVRIEYGRQYPQDGPGDSRYTRAARFMHDWLEQGVLLADAHPAIYIDDHYFNFGGRDIRRRGLMVRVRLEEWAKMIVRPHEGTLSAPKSDRINLIGALAANTSPVLSMYEDPFNRISCLLEGAAADGRAAGLAERDGERHDLWVIDDAAIIGAVAAELAESPLYIADGHHRYESALVYQREQHARFPLAAAGAGFNFVMMTLIAFNDPGVLILPPHRLLRGLPEAKMAGLRENLSAFFDVESIVLDSEGAWETVDRRLSEPERLRLVIFGLDGRNLWLLTLRDFETAQRLMPQFHTVTYKQLDVSMVDHIILENILGLKPEGEAGIAFNYDRDEALAGVTAGEYQLAFIVKPVRPETIKAIADASDRMPRKSTYFYPKLPSGLVLNRLD